MTIPIVAGQFYPTEEELRDVYLRAIASGFSRRGLTANVLPGSEHYIRATAIARALVPAYNNNKVSLAAVSPLDAVGDALEELAGVFGVSRRAAAGAAGLLVVGVVSGSVTIPVGYQCTAPDGTQYRTVTTSTVSNGQTVEVEAVEGGASTDQAPGTVLTWDSASIGLLRRTATVATGGLTGGANADDDETLRGRLIDRLSAPGIGGNWASVKAWTEEASASVSEAFVYPAAQGPASYSVAIMRADGDRTLAPSIVAAVEAYVTAKMPGQNKLNCTTVDPVELDVVIAATLPLPEIAGGAGGGWRDAVPWPNAASGPVKVTSYTASPSTARTDAAALNGLAIGTRIGIWDPVAETMREYTVATVVLDTGFYNITVIGGFQGDPTGAYISTGAANLRAYADSALASFVTLGPGEKTASAFILPRALRKPSPDVESPSDVTSRILAQVTNAHDELLGLDWVARYETGTTTTRTTPGLPAATTDEPKVLVLKHLAFVRS
jgi:uncharacterized phage protein gp47/JayE